MRFLLVLSDAFDAMRAYRGRVALALAVAAILGVLIAVYLPLITGQRDAPQPLTAHGTSAQGPVEPARAAATSTPTPAPTSATTPAPSPAPTAEATPAPTAEATPGSMPAPSPALAPAPATTPTQPATAGTQPVFRVQVGAFRDMARARGLSKRLTRAGFPTWVVPATTADGAAIYRVRTQQALTEEEARQLVARLRQRLPALRPILVASGTKG